jgi:hypothetical protein
MNFQRISKPLILLASVGVTVAASLLTYSRGRGQCPQCGYAHGLHACKHCGWTACLGCWQSMGKYTCPACGRGNP